MLRTLQTVFVCFLALLVAGCGIQPEASEGSQAVTIPTAENLAAPLGAPPQSESGTLLGEDNLFTLTLAGAANGIVVGTGAYTCATAQASSLNSASGADFIDIQINTGLGNGEYVVEATEFNPIQGVLVAYEGRLYNLNPLGVLTLSQTAYTNEEGLVSGSFDIFVQDAEGNEVNVTGTFSFRTTNLCS